MYRLVILNYNDKIYFWHLYIKRVRLILISSFVFNLHVAMTLMYIYMFLHNTMAKPVDICLSSTMFIVRSPSVAYTQAISNYNL